MNPFDVAEDLYGRHLAFKTVEELAEKMKAWGAIPPHLREFAAAHLAYLTLQALRGLMHAQAQTGTSLADLGDGFAALTTAIQSALEPPPPSPADAAPGDADTGPDDVTEEKVIP